MVGMTHFQLAHPLPHPHPSHQPTLYKQNHDITGIVKQLSQKLAVNTAGRVSCETAAISWLHLYSKPYVAVM